MTKFEDNYRKRSTTHFNNHGGHISPVFHDHQAGSSLSFCNWKVIAEGDSANFPMKSHLPQGDPGRHVGGFNSYLPTNLKEVLITAFLDPRHVERRRFWNPQSASLLNYINDHINSFISKTCCNERHGKGFKS